jgi:hypothetical protein
MVSGREDGDAGKKRTPCVSSVWYQPKDEEVLRRAEVERREGSVERRRRNRGVVGSDGS